MIARRKMLVVAVAQALVAAVYTPWIHAQSQSPQQIERVEVTGSNVKRIDAESAAPILVITKEAIERSGQSTVSEVLRSITANNGGAFDDKFTNSFAAGTSGVSLRGLGQNTTLVLINGRRISNYSFAQNLSDNFVDLNSIPLGAVERVEVLKDGASAIYGSDAIAGVINVILRRDFRGVELNASVGQTMPYNDANEYRVGITAGTGDLVKDRFNALVTLDYFKRQPKYLKDREYSKSADQRARGGTDARSPTGSPGSYLFTNGSPAGTNLFSLPFPNCKPEDVIPDYYGPGDNVCGFNFNTFVTDIIPAERVSATGRANFRLTPTTTLFGEVMYNKNTTETRLAPTPAGFNLPVGHNSNPYPFQVRIAYRFLDVGPRITEYTSESARVLGGVKGAFAGWDWEAAVNYSTNEARSVGRNSVDADKVRALVSDGTYNFLDPSKNPASIVENLRISPVRQGDASLTIADVRASREFMQFAGGPGGLALGLEHRREKGSDVPDEATIAGRVVGAGGTSASGSRSASAGFAEVVIPATKSLELQLAARYDHYDGFGGKLSPKAAFRFTPNSQWLFRGSYTEGFRAPSLAELGLGKSINFPSFVDAPRCAAYTAAFNVGKATKDERDGACRSAQYQTESSGNRNLDAEQSRSYFLGFIFEPSRNLNFGLDWFYIDHSDKIAQPTIPYQLNNAAAFPGTVIRNPAAARDLEIGAPGRLRGSGADTTTGLFRSYYNLGGQRASGFDVDLRWRTELGKGIKLGIESITTYYTGIKFSAAPGQPLVQYAGTYQYPRVLSSFKTTWTKGAWELNANANYTHRYRQNNAYVHSHVSSMTTFDLVASYNGLKNTKLTVGVRNVLDTDPPFSDDETQGYDFATHDSRGRFVFANLKYTWK
jgi:iron complex outermembrane recepter protein